MVLGFEVRQEPVVLDLELADVQLGAVVTAQVMIVAEPAAVVLAAGQQHSQLARPVNLPLQLRLISFSCSGVLLELEGRCE